MKSAKNNNYLSKRNVDNTFPYVFFNTCSHPFIDIAFI